MNDLLYRKPVLAVSAILFALMALAIWIWGVGEERGIAANRAQRLDDERLALSRMRLDMGNLENGVGRYRDNLAQIEYFREHYLKQREERMIAISDFLVKTSKSHGLTLDQVRYVVKPAKNQNMVIYHMDLPLTGRYRDIRAFIQDIEASDMFLTITKLDLEDESGFSGAVRVDLSLATYFEGV